MTDPYVCGECGPVDEDEEIHRDIHRSTVGLISEAERLAGAPVGWWWLSFCDPDLPKGSQFLGAALVEGHDPLSAIQSAWKHGCNPGGEVAFVQLPVGFNPPEGWTNRLLSREEAERGPTGL